MKSAQKELSENGFCTLIVIQRTITVQSENKIQSRKLIENNRLTSQPCLSSKIGSFVTATSDFQSLMQQIYDHQVLELKTIDIQNSNISFQISYTTIFSQKLLILNKKQNQRQRFDDQKIKLLHIINH
ncbi:unnamed protein product [Paramecium sonneborni]|uniref:Uncharacterized protein n=1 Tax=Paramecium sonneborni TaxID=65129 RepID=A0A8S1R2A7_9CILI|nr:unnamed protein product [Paramecium sonneborni]